MEIFCYYAPLKRTRKTFLFLVNIFNMNGLLDYTTLGHHLIYHLFNHYLVEKITPHICCD